MTSLIRLKSSYPRAGSFSQYSRSTVPVKKIAVVGSVARVRIEKAKTLLSDPNRRVSEVACDVGFQSLTHFNRIFRKLVGQSPTVYRRGAKKPG